MTLAALAVVAVSCSKTEQIIKDKDIDTVGIDAMTFTNAGVIQQSPTKASSSLSSGFVVSTWKRFGTADRQTVMDSYKVEYKTTGTAWDGNVRPYWDYTGVSGQYEKFWDYSGFPYRFHAIAPYPADLTGFGIDGNITIPAAYSSQSCADGAISPANAEPYLVAQVARDADGKDYDVFADNTEITKNAAQGKTRAIALPFHHLNSKIRFAIYSTSPWVSANHVYVKNLKVETTSSDFVTAASGYSAPASGWQIKTGNSGFTGLTKSSANLTLLSLTGGAGVEEYDLNERQTQKTAYWLKCQDGLAQIPQTGVEMKVSCDLVLADGSVKKSFANVPVKLPDDSTVFDWQSGYIYTYYLIITNVDEMLDIEFTATLAPWEDVSGSFSATIED